MLERAKWLQNRLPMIKLHIRSDLLTVPPADSEDEAMENEIDQNVDLLHGAAGRLNKLARAMGNEVDVQNKHIERIGGKVDKVDDEIALNRNRLDRIH
jgi:hypothetical protein